MSLFPTAQRSTHLVQFNAGKCTREGNLIKPDLRKGVIYMDQSDDQLMHFYWKERKSSTAEDDFIIFPDEAELLRVDECTTGRVYVLKFKSSSQKVFYWMQSKNDEKDEELVSRVNQLINDPSSASNENENSNRDGDLGNADSDLLQILSGGNGDLEMTQENLLQFIRNAGGLSNLSSSLQTPYDGEHVIPNSKWTELQAKLSEIDAPTTTTLDNELDQVLDAETLNPILDDSDIRSALFPFVSDSAERSAEEIEQLVASQQFKQRLHVLHTAIEQDALSSLLDDLEAEKDTASFLKAVSEQAKRRKNRGSEAMDED